MAQTQHHGTIVDKRKKLPFVMVERVVLRAKALSNNAKLLYLFLIDYAGEEGSCFPGQVRLAQDLGAKSVDTVQRALAELRQLKLIDWKQQGRNRPNVYYLLPLEGNRALDATTRRGAPARSDTAPVRFPDTAPMRSKQDPGERESVKQQHPQPIERGNGEETPRHERDGVVAGLVKIGVTPVVARTLAKGYPQARIREKLEILAYLQRIDSPLVAKNPPGWARMAIEQDYYPPAQFLAARDRARKRHRVNQHAADAHERELLERAAELQIDPAQRAGHWLATWEETLRAISRPALGPQERASRLAALTQRFAEERDDFFAQYPGLRHGGDAEIRRAPQPLQAPKIASG